MIRNAAAVPLYKPGDCVGVALEMLRNYEAIFDTYLPGTERARVLIKILNDRQMVLELNKNQVIGRNVPTSGA